MKGKVSTGDVGGLGWDPLSLIRITEELIETKVAALVYKT
jgi:hypothetical protein